MSVDPDGQFPDPGANRRTPTALERIFLGPGGLRAGWRAALYLSIFLLFMTALQFGAALVHVGLSARRGGPVTAGSLFIQELILAVCAIAAARVMSGMERRRFRDYGMPWRGAFGAEFWHGAVWGLAGVTLLIFFIRAFGGYSFGAVALSGTGLVRYTFLWIGFFIVVGIAEEFFFRGYLQFTLSSGMGFWPAAILLSLVFGAVHLSNPGEGWPGALGVFAVGMFLCFTLRRTGALWFAIGWHAAFDFGETYLYSVPDSGIVMPGQLFAAHLHGPRWLTGGSVGPEASVFDFVMLAILFVVIDRLYRPRPGTDADSLDTDTIAERR